MTYFRIKTILDDFHTGHPIDIDALATSISYMKSVAIVIQVSLSICDDNELLCFATRSFQQWEYVSLFDVCHDSFIALFEVSALTPNLPPAFATVDNYPLPHFVALAGKLHYLEKRPLNSSEYHSTILLISSGEVAQRVDEVNCGYSAVVGFSYSYLCWARGCPNTFTSSERKFSKCAGCQRVSYCSKECQRRAWKDPLSPHKAVCATITALVQALNIPVKPPHVDAHLPTRLECEKRGISPESLLDLSRHYRTIRATHSAAEPSA